MSRGPRYHFNTFGRLRLIIGLAAIPPVLASFGAARADLPVPALATGTIVHLDEPGPYDKLRELLRLLYALLGGNPANLPESTGVEATMTTIMSWYSQHGPPQGLTEQEKADARALVRDTNFHVNAANPPLNPQITTQFKGMLVSLYQALGGNPADLSIVGPNPY